MTALSLYEVQKAVYGRLAATTGLTSLLAQGASSVLDYVPPTTPFPYLALGDVSARPYDTQQTMGCEINLLLNVFSQAEGATEIKSIMAQAYQALHDAALAVTGQQVLLCQMTQADVSLESDGLTRRGVLRFRILTEAV